MTRGADRTRSSPSAQGFSRRNPGQPDPSGLIGPQPDLLPDRRGGLCRALAQPACRLGAVRSLRGLVPGFDGGGPFRHPLMRERRRPSRSPWALVLRKVTVLVPDSSVEGLRQFARELCHHQAPVVFQMGRGWRKLSPSAELLVDPGCGARCAIRDTGAAAGARPLPLGGYIARRA